MPRLSRKILLFLRFLYVARCTLLRSVHDSDVTRQLDTTHNAARERNNASNVNATLSSRVIDVNNLGDVLAADWTTVTSTDEGLGAVVACDEMVTWTQQAVTLAVHADGTVLACL